MEQPEERGVIHVIIDIILIMVSFVCFWSGIALLQFCANQLDREFRR